MATYLELDGLVQDGNLFKKIRTACVISANTISNEIASVPNHSNRLLWAKQVYENPDVEARRMMPAVLAANKDQTVAVIQAATDLQIQAAVDASVNLFATGA